MTLSADGRQSYTLIVPRVDFTGPTSVATDLANEAAAEGWDVSLLFLSGVPKRDDIDPRVSVRRWRIRDLWKISGVVHSHGLRPDLVAWLFSWNPNCTTMCTFHGQFPAHLHFDYPAAKVGLAWGLWRRAALGLDSRICISRTMQRYYRRFYPSMRTDLVLNFRAPRPETQEAAPAGFEDWRQRQHAAGRPVLAYVGSLIERKNILNLAREIALSPELALAVCGDGPLASRLREISAGSAKGNILFLGHLARPEVVVTRADMLALPSHAEGMPLVVLEAASQGIPSLLSNIAVHRELARTGICAVFDHRNFTDLPGQARRLWAIDGAGRQSISETWRRNFSPKAGFGAHKRLIGMITSRKASQGPTA